MSKTAIAIPIAAGMVIIGSAFASVAPQDRHVQYPVLGGISVIGLAVAALLLRGAIVTLPPAGRRMPGTGATVIPFRRAA